MAAPELQVKIGADTSALSAAQNDINKLGQSIGGMAQSGANSFNQLGASITGVTTEIVKFGQNSFVVTQEIASGFKEIEAEIVVTQNNLRGFQNAMKQATDVNQVNYLSKGVKILEGNIDDLRKKQEALLSQTKKTFGGSTQVVTDFGRVLQDAPFGFVAIQNNIGPLVESFGQLKVSAAAAGTTITKQLLGALSGPAGIGLAISAVTAIVTFATTGFGAWSRAFGDNAKAAKESKDAIEGVYSSVAKEATQVQSLVAVIDSETASRKRKLDAIKELKSIQPDIFKDLKLEGDTVKGLNTAYQEYITSLQTVIAAKIKQQQLEQVTERILKQQGKTLVGAELIQKQVTDAVRQTTKEVGSYNKTTLALKDQKSAADLNRDLKEQARLFEELQQLQAGIKVNPDNSKAKDEIDKVAEALNKLKADREELARNPLIPSLDKPEADIKLIEAAIKRLLELKVPADSTIIAKLIGMQDWQALLRADLIKNASKFIIDEVPVSVGIVPEYKITPDPGLANKSTEELRKGILDRLKANGITSITSKDGVTVPITPYISTTLLKKGESDLNDRLKALSQAVTDFGTNVKTQLATSIGEGLGNLLTGSSNIGDFVTGIFAGIGDAISQLGAQMIALSPIIAGLKAAFSSLSPAGLLVGGIALLAIGQTLKNIKPKAFAKGGIVSGPTNALIGEYAGASGNPEVVAPLNKLQSMLDFNGGGGGDFSGTITTRVSGADLLLILQREQKRQAR